MSQQIAVVGMSCRFPGCFGPESYWKVLVDRRSTVVEVPEYRWSVRQHYAEKPQKNRTVSRWAGLVEGFDWFDAKYFNILPREAELMDPQQRISLELAVECFEDAGYGVLDVKGSNIGVYLGVCNFDYKEKLEKHLDNIPGHLSTGTYTTLIPNRVSFFLDLKGPSVAIDTACSSSLVALSHALQAIQSGDCESALVGGVSYLFSHTYFVAFSQAGMLSPTGSCKTFDAQADGYVRGEGAGMVLIKPLDKALADNDQIYGIINSVAVNHGGSVSTITSPSAYAQANVVKKALQKAQVPANSISYIEAHGTGTPKGDPIEVNALKRAFRAAAQERNESLGKHFCALSCAKSNIGHLESAAGIAGLIKGLLSIRKQFLLPLIHFNELNPRISLKDSCFRILQEGEKWTSDGGPRRFGVSSFGFGGVNAHAIVSEFDDFRHYESEGPSKHKLFLFSAATAARLKTYAFLLAEFLQSNPSVAVQNCAYTLARRTNLKHRIVFSYENRSDLIEKLVAYSNGLAPETIQSFSEDALGEDAVAWMGMHLESARHLFSDDTHRIVHIPPYPFQHREYFPTELLKQPQAMLQTPREEKVLFALEQEFQHFGEESDSAKPIEQGSPIVLALVSDEIEIELRKMLPGSRLVAVPAPQRQGTGSDWIEWYLAVLNVLRDAIIALRPSHCIIVSDQKQELMSTFYAHTLSLDKEYGLPCAWYHWDEPCADYVGDYIKPRIYHKFSKSFFRLLHLNSTNRSLEAKEERYRVSSFTAIKGEEIFPAELRPSVLITGGAGGIGQVFAKYLAETFGSTVSMVGRRAAHQIPEASLQTKNGSIRYFQADCADRTAMKEVISSIVSESGRIDILLHGAGQVRDKSIFFKTETDVRDVVEGKVIGCDLLDELTSELPIQQFIVFSSITGLFGNPGQTDYAAANRYLKEFVARRNQQFEAGVRSGKSTAIHWPYWRDGGIQINDSLIEMLRETTGTEPLENAEGIDILNYALVKKPSQLCVVRGKKEAIERALVGDTTSLKSVVMDEDDLVANVTSVIVQVSGLDAKDIDIDARFPELGINSLAMQSLAHELSENFGVTITGVSLAKFPTVKAIAGHIRSLSLPSRFSTEKVASGSEGSVTSQTATPDSLETPPNKERGCAVIGLSLRTRGSDDWRESWSYLSDKVLSPQAYPENRWSLLPGVLKQGVQREKIQGYFLDGCLAFDHKFFGISRREAMLMDPQHRLMIESVWSALTDAGYSPEKFSRRKTAVFVCIDATDYAVIAGFDASPDEFAVHASASYLSANRLSHLFNLQGPSETINVACPSVYSAVDRAKSLIETGVVDQAVIASAQLNLLPSRFEMLVQNQLISPDGVVAPFDESARGFLRSEGVGCLILKDLSIALQDQDEVLVKIESAATWHGGRGSALTTPNSLTHLNVIEAAFHKTKADPRRLRYVEAHGTASPVGDIAEAEAIADFLRQADVDSPCAVSSMKSNVGHLEVCSGIAGFVRSILAIRNGQVPGIPELQTLNPNIDKQRLRIQNNRQPLPEPSKALVGLLAYGLGGVSSFVLLAPFPNNAFGDYEENSEDEKWVLLSANSVAALKRYIHSFVAEIEKYRHQTPLKQLVSTLRYHRSHQSARMAVGVRNYQQLVDKLRFFLNDTVVENLFASFPTSDADQRSTLSQVLPSEVRQWLDGAEFNDDEIRIPEKRCFWPKYPFDRSDTLYVATQQEKGVKVAFGGSG